MPSAVVGKITKHKKLSPQFSSFAEWSGAAYADQLPTIIVFNNEKNALLKMSERISHVVRLPLKIYPPVVLRIGLAV